MSQKGIKIYLHASAVYKTFLGVILQTPVSKGREGTRRAGRERWNTMGGQDLELKEDAVTKSITNFMIITATYATLL